MAYPFAQHNLRFASTFETSCPANFRSWAGNVPAGGAIFFSAQATQVWQVITGTSSSGSVAGVSLTYNYTNASFPGADANAFVGLTFLVAGFANTHNNGTFVCIASGTGFITLANTDALSTNVSSAFTATIQSNGWVYASNWTTQNLSYVGLNVAPTPTPTAITAVSSTGAAMTISGTWQTGAGNAYVGMWFTTSGFTGADVSNNGTFICTASSQGSITLTSTNSTGPTNGHGGTPVVVIIETGTGGLLALPTGLNITVDNGNTGTLSAGNTGTYAVVASGTQSVVLTNATPGVAETKVGFMRMDQFKVTRVANTNGTTTVYTGIFPLGNQSGGVTNGINWGYKDYVFVISGFNTPANNGTFLCVASTATTLTLVNNAGVAEGPSFSPPTSPAARGMSGMSWCMQTAGYTQTNDPGQAVWSLIAHTNQITTANGHSGSGTVSYTLSVTPNSRLRIGQYFTVTGTTNFNGSFLISGFPGGNVVNVTATNSNTTESGLTATGQVLPFTIVPPWSMGSSYHYFVVQSGDLASYFRGTFDPTQQYGNGNFVWGGSADPNYYITFQNPTMLIVSATTGGNTVYTYVGGNNTAILAGQHVSVTGMANTTYNITDVLITAAGSNTFTVVSTTQSGTAHTNQGGVANITVHNDAATQGSSTSPRFWIPWIYEIWQANDSATLAVPTQFYLKLDWGTAFTGSTAPGFAFQLGTTTTGHGALTGLRGFREPEGFNPIVPSGPNFGSAESQFWSNGSGGEFVIALWTNGQSTNYPAYLWNLEWGKTNSGQGNGLWMTYSGCASSSTSTSNGFGSQTVWLTTPPIGVAQIVTPANKASYPLQIPTNGGSFSAQPQEVLWQPTSANSWNLNTFSGAETPIAPVFALEGPTFSNPLTGLVTLNTFDQQYFNIFPVIDAYGNPHSYLTLNTNYTAFTQWGGGGNRLQVAIRWDT